MNKHEQQLEALQDIRQLMRQSTRFLSLSGLSGVIAGVYALGGAWVCNNLLNKYTNESGAPGDRATYEHLIYHCALLGVGVLLASVFTAFLLSSRKARKNGETLFNPIAFKLLINMFIPLLAGGVFCFAAVYQGENHVIFVVPAMLIFYGLALINASKYTIHDVRYLGLLQLLLGMICLFLPRYGLLFWLLGFGVLHIVYGTIMWFKYDRNQETVSRK